MSVRPKVFCIGFQKTGTTSLHSALTTLGYRTASVLGRNLSADELRDTGATLAIETMQGFDAAQDMPWPIFFRELDVAFPQSKFVLTLRDAESWYSSIESHFGDTPNEMEAFVYGKDAPFPAGNRARYLDVYEKHLTSVRDYFEDRPGDLLEMDLARGDGWQKLCAFLGNDIPEIPFPVKNTRAARQSIGYRLKRKLLSLTGRAPQPENLP